ncbi:MAG: RIP metalloprotease RseP [Bacteroidales bacterium]|nr:RIP metalloprotease RseP [Bacteroidales bacterium]
MVVLIKTLQVVLALSILVFFHELGHFLFARIFGIRVDKFYLFFDIGGVKLFSTKGKIFTRLFPAAASWKTEYGIGWLPLGGYCKIAGMIDESMDTEALKSEPQPWEFRSHPVWQRILVMSGGVINNFLLAILVFSGMLYRYGDTYISNDESHVWVNEFAYDMGFRSGDRILSLDGYVPEDFDMLQAEIVRKRASQVKVLRGSDTLSIYIDQSLTADMLEPGNRMFTLAVRPIVEQFSAESLNKDSGIAPGDTIISVAGVPVSYVQELKEALDGKAGQSVEVSYLRGSDTLQSTLHLDANSLAGIEFAIEGVRHKTYTLAQSFPAGCAKAWDTIAGYIRDLKLVFTPSTGAYKSVGSVIAIGQVFPAAWSWPAFFYILAILSIMLGVMNLLPIPALDGGHIVFGIYELITGRKPGEKFLLVMQMIGMVLLLLLMFLAFGNDIRRLIH